MRKIIKISFIFIIMFFIFIITACNNKYSKNIKDINNLIQIANNILETSDYKNFEDSETGLLTLAKNIELKKLKIPSSYQDDILDTRNIKIKLKQLQEEKNNKLVNELNNKINILYKNIKNDIKIHTDNNTVFEIDTLEYETIISSIEKELTKFNNNEIKYLEYNEILKDLKFIKDIKSRYNKEIGDLVLLKNKSDLINIDIKRALESAKLADENNYLNANTGLSDLIKIANSKINELKLNERIYLLDIAPAISKLNIILDKISDSKIEKNLEEKLDKIYTKRDIDFTKDYGSSSDNIYKETKIVDSTSLKNYNNFIRSYNDSNDTNIDESYNTSYEEVKIKNNVSDYSIFDNTIQSAFYPGSLVKINNKSSNAPVVPINGIYQNNTNIFASLTTATSSPAGASLKRKIEKLTPATYAQNLKDIITTNIDDKTNIAKTTQAKLIKTNSHLELEAALGVDLKILKFGVSANIKSKKNKETSFYNIVINQKYYSVIAEPKNNISDYFANTTYEDISKKVGSDNVLGYVSSVTYGRIIIITIEMDKSKTELNFDANIGYDSLVTKMSAYAKARKEAGQDTLNMSVFIYGGGDETNGLIRTYNTPEDVDKIFETLNQTKTGYANVAAPISYSISYLNSSLPARTSFERTYIREIKTPKEISSLNTYFTLDNKIVDRQNLRVDDFSKKDIRYVVETKNDYSFFVEDIKKSIKFKNSDNDYTLTLNIDNTKVNEKKYEFLIKAKPNISKIDFSFNYKQFNDEFLTSSRYVDRNEFNIKKQLKNIEKDTTSTSHTIKILQDDVYKLDIVDVIQKDGSYLKYFINKNILNNTTIYDLNIPQHVNNLKFEIYSTSGDILEDVYNNDPNHVYALPIYFSNYVSRPSLNIDTNNLLLVNRKTVFSSPAFETYSNSVSNGAFKTFGITKYVVDNFDILIYGSRVLISDINK